MAAAGEPPTGACGALGRFDPTLTGALALSMGFEGGPATTTPRAVLYAGEPAGHWTTGDAQGWWWDEPIAPATPPRSWQDAARDPGGCGFAVTGGRALVHSGISGMRSIYLRRIAGATYFATRIDPLARLPGKDLSPDRDAWSQIMLLGYPLGQRTPFRQIERLPAWSTLEHGRLGPRIRRHPWPWLEVTPTGREDAGERLLEAIDEVLARAQAGEVRCLLSGGWDSRLLAIASVRRALPATAWTARFEDEHGDETAMAAGVAAALGMRHVLVEPSDVPYLDDAAETARLVDHQTPFHVWMMPLARALRRAGGLTLDGLGGDVLVKLPRFVDAPLLQAGARARSSVIWERLGFSRGLRLLHGRTGEDMAERARAALDAVAADIGDHPHAAALTALASRTMRGVAPAPTALIGAASPVALPLLHDPVARAALSIPPGTKLGGGFYRALLTDAHPEAGPLPSTHDWERGRLRVSLAESEPSALRRYRDALLGERVGGLVSDRLAEAARDDALAPLLRLRAPRHMIRCLVLLDRWLETYGSVLTDASALTRA